MDHNPRANPQAGLDTPRGAALNHGSDSRHAAIEATLAAAQNADGGWAYFPGKQSWLEPTAYALLALAGTPDGAVFARGWERIRSWELPGGGWRGCAAVDEAHWATSLVVTLHA